MEWWLVECDDGSGGRVGRSSREDEYVRVIRLVSYMVRTRPEALQTPGQLIRSKSAKTLHGDLFYGEGRDGGGVPEGVPELDETGIVSRRFQNGHECTGEGVPSAGGVSNLRDRDSGHGHRTSVFLHQPRASRSPFDDDGARASFEQ